MRFVPLIAIVFVFMLSCTFRTADPPRPKGVPPEAVWVGGPDGGVFLIVREATGAPDTYLLTVYHDRTGEVWYNGPAAVQPPGKGKLEPARAETFSGWDGEKLILTDGRVLQPAKR